MKILGINGGPRKGGNTELLLEETLKGAEAAGGKVQLIKAANYNISGCLECGGCDKSGVCIVKDAMQEIYPLLTESDIIFLSAPIFFYSFPSQVKALIDRTQANWSGRMKNKTREERKLYDSGVGYLLSVGATQGQRLFDCAELTAKYFFDALDMAYMGGLLFKGVESKGDILKVPEAMKKAFDYGQKAVRDFS